MPNLHPLIVHFPIALIFVILACDFIGFFMKRDFYLKIGSVITIFALVGGLAALLSGILAEETVEKSIGSAHDLLERHELMGYMYIGVLAAMAIFRFAIGKRLFGRLGLIALLLSLIASGIVAYGGYLGGEMVYAHGVGVIKTAPAFDPNKIIEDDD